MAGMNVTSGLAKSPVRTQAASAYGGGGGVGGGAGLPTPNKTPPPYGQPGSLTYNSQTGMVGQQPPKALDPYDSPIRQVVQAGGLGYEQNGTIFVPGGQGGTPAMSGGGGGGAGGGGGGGGTPSGGGGLGMDEIMGIIDKLKPAAPPPREGAPAPPPTIAAPEAVASPSAKSQGFARAKDNAGRISAAALKNLRSEMVGRGIEGSGVEGQLAANVMGEGARGVADASFAQERAAEDQKWDAAKLGYTGAIQQRAGDQGMAGNNFAGNIQQRSQDINAQPNMLSLFPTIASLMKPRY